VDFDVVLDNLKKLRENCKKSWEYLSIVAKHDSTKQLKSKYVIKSSIEYYPRYTVLLNFMSPICFKTEETSGFNFVCHLTSNLWTSRKKCVFLCTDILCADTTGRTCRSTGRKCKWTERFGKLYANQSEWKGVFVLLEWTFCKELAKLNAVFFPGWASF